MTRAKVFGEDITIRLLSDDESTPLILDFDMCEIASLRTNKMYKAIGKRISKPHSSTSGYKIVLTRAKRDNYIEALTQYLDFFAEKGLDFPTFTVERIVNYQYSVKELNPENEFNNIKDKPIEGFNGGRTLNDLIKAKEEAKKAKSDRALLNVATLLLPEVILGLQQGNQRYETFKNQLNNTANFINNTFYNNVGEELENREEIKLLRENIKKHNNFEVFQSKTLYKNCTIVEETFSDKPKEITEERFVLYSSNRINLSEENQYEDTYLSNMFTNRTQDKLNKTANLIIEQSENVINTKIGSELQKLVNDSYNKVTKEFLQGVRAEYYYSATDRR